MRARIWEGKCKRVRQAESEQVKENDGEDGKVREREEVTGMKRMTA